MSRKFEERITLLFFDDELSNRLILEYIKVVTNKRMRSNKCKEWLLEYIKEKDPVMYQQCLKIAREKMAQGIPSSKELLNSTPAIQSHDLIPQENTQVHKEIVVDKVIETKPIEKTPQKNIAKNVSDVTPIPRITNQHGSILDDEGLVSR